MHIHAHTPAGVSQAQTWLHLKAPGVLGSHPNAAIALHALEQLCPQPQITRTGYTPFQHNLATHDPPLCAAAVSVMCAEARVFVCTKAGT